jgi:hypothetical protein
MYDNPTHRWEGPRDARGAKDGKRQYEDHDLRATIERATQYVVVLAIPSRVVSTQPKLRHESDEYGRCDDGVYAGVLRDQVMRAVPSDPRTRAHQPSRILEYKGQYDPVDLDGTDVLPTLRRRRQKRNYNTR